MGHWICSSPCIHRGEPAGLTDVTCAGSQALLFCPTEVAQKHLMHAVGGPFGFDIGWMNVECSSLLPRYTLGLVCLQILPLLWGQTRRILIIRQYRGFVSPSTLALPESSLVAHTTRESDLTCCITQVDLGHTRVIYQGTCPTSSLPTAVLIFNLRPIQLPNRNRSGTTSESQYFTSFSEPFNYSAICTTWNPASPSILV